MGDLDGTYVGQEAHAVDRLKLGYIPVHHKGHDVEEGRMSVCHAARHQSHYQAWASLWRD